LTPVDLVIRIVSAKYGLLRPEDKIANYDRRLNPIRDRTLIARTRKRLERLATRGSLLSVFGILGRDYLGVIPNSWLAGRKTSLRLASGPPGARVRQMLDWILQGS
jgi:hypothetical protein